MIETIILCTIFGVFILFAFIKGVQIGVKIRKDESIELKNPIQYVENKIHEFHADKEMSKEQQIMDMNLLNIENYNGSSIGQQELPR